MTESNLGTFNLEELNRLSEEEIKKIIKYEYFTEVRHETANYKYYTFMSDNSTRVTVYNLFDLLLQISEVENGQIYNGDYYKSKPLDDLWEGYKSKYNSNTSYERVLSLIKFLYLHRYIDFYRHKEFDENTSLNLELGSSSDPTQKWRFNLNWLYQKYPYLFELEEEIPEPMYAEDGATIMDYVPTMVVIQAEEVYNSIKYEGSILHLLEKAPIHMIEKGFSFYHSLSQFMVVRYFKASQTKMDKKFQEYQGLLKEQEKSINKNLEDNITNINEELEKKIISVNEDLESKTKDFHKNILNILALLMAAFAFIGVNVSAIPKIEESFAENVLVLNLSLILVLTVTFWILKMLVFGEKIENKGWYWIPALSVFFLICVFFLLGSNVDKSYLKSYEKKIEDQRETYNQDLREQQTEHEKQIQELQNELEKVELRIDNIEPK
ncbi:hypothetical protein [Priestia aryabhattai]|uniref:hypothetical protein n=1 Tax=Priestia aryabhattai TaxID=412384 RepID=UPI003CA1193A